MNFYFWTRVLLSACLILTVIWKKKSDFFFLFLPKYFVAVILLFEASASDPPPTVKCSTSRDGLYTLGSPRTLKCWMISMDSFCVYRNQSPRRHLSVRLSRGKTGQRILGGRLWWRISANIFSLVGVKPPTFSFGCNHGSALTARVLLYRSAGRRIHLSVITSWQLQENTELLLWCAGHASNMTGKCGPVFHFQGIILFSKKASEIRVPVQRVKAMYTERVTCLFLPL